MTTGPPVLAPPGQVRGVLLATEHFWTLAE